MKRTKYGIVGTGYFGAEIARAVHRLPNAEVSLVFDPENGRMIAREVDAEATNSMEEACSAAGVDAIVIASPNHAHRDAAVLAAQSGKHVFCEKPIALDRRDASAMVVAARNAGVHFMAGHVTHFMHGVRWAKERIREGAIGELVAGRAVRNGWEEPGRGGNSWKKSRQHSGGHLYHHIHELDLMLAIFNLPEVVTMASDNLVHDSEGDGDEDDVLACLLEFPSGAIATLEYGSAYRWPEHYVLIQGTAGAIRIDLQDPGVELRTPSGVATALLHRDADEDAERRRIYTSSETDGAVMYGGPGRRPPGWLSGIVEDEIRYFQDLILGAQPDEEFRALTDGTAAIASVTTADALTASSRQGCKVRLDQLVNGEL